MRILSIDLGSSCCKAALISARGEILALSTRGYTPQHPQPGHAQLDPDVFFDVVTSRQAPINRGNFRTGRRRSASVRTEEPSSPQEAMVARGDPRF